MTAACLGGTSSANPLYGTVLALSSGAIGQFLNRIDGRWAAAFAGFLSLATWDLTTFCTVDPPPVPAFNAADALALLNPLNPRAKSDAQLKLLQLVGAYLWYDVCKCDDGTIPVRPGFPAAPANLPHVDPVIIAPPSAVTPCVTRDIGDLYLTNSQSYFRGGTGWGGHNANAIRFTMHTDVHDPPGPQVIFQYDLEHGQPIVLDKRYQFHLTNAMDFVTTVPIPAGADTVAFTVIGEGAAAGTTNTRTLIEVYCDGAYPDQQPANCCPPDPTLMAQVAQILDFVTLLQRQKAPFGYVPGVRHNGLAGNGQFAISGLVGVSVILSVLPAYIGNIAGDPAELFDVGFVTLGTADGWHRSVRIEHSPTLILPIEGSETLLGYTLKPGVVVDVLELVREP